MKKSVLAGRHKKFEGCQHTAKNVLGPKAQYINQRRNGIVPQYESFFLLAALLKHPLHDQIFIDKLFHVSNTFLKQISQKFLFTRLKRHLTFKICQRKFCHVKGA